MPLDANCHLTQNALKEDWNEWRQSDDIVWRFCEEKLVFDPEYIIVANDFEQAFNGWLQRTAPATAIRQAHS